MERYTTYQLISNLRSYSGPGLNSEAQLIAANFQGQNAAAIAALKARYLADWPR